jgi:hypothetical protein
LENEDKSNAGGSPSPLLPPSPHMINADDDQSRYWIKERPYNERKDHRITTLAICVIGFAALVSGIALLWPIVCEGILGLSAPALPEWPAETLRLSLVASLAFVMGSGTK